MITYHDETGRFAIAQTANDDTDRAALTTFERLEQDDYEQLCGVFTDEATARDLVWRYGLTYEERSEFIAQYWHPHEEASLEEAAAYYFDSMTDRNGAGWVVRLDNDRVALYSEVPLVWQEETDEGSGPDNPVGR